MQKKTIWLILIFSAALFLRLYLLTEIPSGMTHDEADHGMDAWGVVNGIRPLYFTVGYGREPFFDYATAILMSFLGPTYLAGRLTSVIASMIMLGGMYLWCKRAFNTRIALWTCAGLATSFWAVMTARHALRSVTMPMFLVLALAFYWKGLPSSKQKSNYGWIGAGICIGLSFYTYMPARILWFLFPCILFFAFIAQRDLFKTIWTKTVGLLALAGAIGLPLYTHLKNNPVEGRIDQLRQPIEDARNGDWSTIFTNTKESLQLFSIKGDFGEIIWRYNIPERPWLSLTLASLFYIGIAIALYYLCNKKNPRFQLASAVALCWLIGGMLPSFITGLEASTTRAIGMQPVLYLFPALTLDTIWRLIRNRWTIPQLGLGMTAISIALFGWEFADTAQSYFLEWGNHPETRLQYEVTLAEMMHYTNEQEYGRVHLSVDDPARFHDPSTALMMLGQEETELTYFNGQHAFLLTPSRQNNLLFSTGANLHPFLQPYLPVEPTNIIQLRVDDLDPTIFSYEFNGVDVVSQWDQYLTQIDPIQYGNHATLTGYQLIEDETELQIITAWELLQPHDELTFFTHILDGDAVIANDTRLDAPSYYWQTGTMLLQRHSVPLYTIQPDATYQIGIGVADMIASDPNNGLFINLPATQNGTQNGERVTITTYQK